MNDVRFGLISKLCNALDPNILADHQKAAPKPGTARVFIEHEAALSMSTVGGNTGSQIDVFTVTAPDEVAAVMEHQLHYNHHEKDTTPQTFTSVKQEIARLFGIQKGREITYFGVRYGDEESSNAQPEIDEDEQLR